MKGLINTSLVVAGVILLGVLGFVIAVVSLPPQIDVTPDKAAYVYENAIRGDTITFYDDVADLDCLAAAVNHTDTWTVQQKTPENITIEAVNSNTVSADPINQCMTEQEAQP